jgi:hypothetical protein
VAVQPQGKPADVAEMLLFDDVVASLGRTGERWLGLQIVTLATIVGAVSRIRPSTGSSSEGQQATVDTAAQAGSGRRLVGFETTRRTVDDDTPMPRHRTRGASASTKVCTTPTSSARHRPRRSPAPAADTPRIDLVGEPERTPTTSTERLEVDVFNDTVPSIQRRCLRLPISLSTGNGVRQPRS